MAIAPLNKFLTFSVPVAPGEQTIYTTPVGVSAILLYAQTSNVGIGTTYPKITFTHRRKTIKTGNVRNNRIIKEAEVPPNDSLIIIDSRLVLERTALISDSIIISGIQTGIVSISSCRYDNNTGITTITTITNHNFSVGDEITMSGLAFTCNSTSGLTTTIYPSPQASFIVTQVVGVTTFVTNTGAIAGIAHTYVSGGQVGPLHMEFICSILENSTA
jgi:hypothetical protein